MAFGVRQGAFLASAAVVLIASAPAIAQQRLFNVPAQDARTGIPEFARQAGIQISAPTGHLGNKRTNAVRGSKDVSSALAELIQGTGLTVASNDGRMIVLQLPSAVGNAVAGGPNAGNKNPPSSLGEAQAAGAVATNESATQQAIVVTGTNIRGVAPAGSPLTMYSRRYIDESGAATVGQFMQIVPQNFSDVEGVQSQFIPGDRSASDNFGRGSALNLRGLGSGSTLALLDGERLAPAGLSGLAPDVSLIPLGAIDHIEVLSDGASAIYGADAVAGVANFVLRHDFDGVQATARTGTSTQGGGTEIGASLLAGDHWSSGNAMISYDHYNQEPVRENQRDLPDDTDTGARGSFLIPKQHRDSILASVSQNLSDSTVLKGSLLVSRRRFATFSQQPSISSTVTGSSSYYGGNLAIDQDLGGNWKLRVNGQAAWARGSATTVSVFSSSSSTSKIDTRSQIDGIDAVADGSVIRLPAGDVRASIGLSGRKESFATAAANDSHKRTVWSAFAEILVPVVGDANSIALVKKLELSAAVRYDHYGDVGGTTNPKVGLSWSPAARIKVRADYATSFRAPPLEQLFAPRLTYDAFPLKNQSGGTTGTILDLSAGNPTLKPETSRSFTFGFDVDPIKGSPLRLSATYYNIDYKNRIAAPPVLNGNITGILATPAAFAAIAPFFNFSPTASQIAAYVGSPGFQNPLHVPISSIVAIFDDRLQNIAESKIAGLDFSGTYTADTPFGVISPNVSLTYTLKSSLRSASSTPSVSQVDGTFLPARFRMRDGISWSSGMWASSLALNYVSGYPNTFLLAAGGPAMDIHSWTTVDWQLNLRIPARSIPVFSNMRITASVRNIFNAGPPEVKAPTGVALVGYDAANASPLGRFVSLQLTKTW